MIVSFWVCSPQQLRNAGDLKRRGKCEIYLDPHFGATSSFCPSFLSVVASDFTPNSRVLADNAVSVNLRQKCQT